MDFSLLFPEGSDRHVEELTQDTINDLSIDFILDALTVVRFEKEQIEHLFHSICFDEDVIRYRCDIFDDFMKFPKLREDMETLVLHLKELKDLARFQKDTEAPDLWSLINRLREIDEYVSAINMIKSTLYSLDIKSGGMLRLKQIVTDISEESGFDDLKADIDETLNKARNLKSITIGVNLDELLRPKTAGVLSLNDTEFTSTGLMTRFMNFADRKSEITHGNDIQNLKHFHPANGTSSKIIIGSYQQNAANHNVHLETSAVTGGDPLSAALKKPVTSILKKTVSDIKSKLRRYVDISGYSLVSLMSEIIFYIRWAELIERIRNTGMPVCKAEITDKNKRECVFKDIYNLKLAINKTKGEDINIVTNDIDFDDDKRIYILTGPNRGGKTIFTQAVGLVMLMAQWGIYVPASYAKLSITDNIFTHFPADENNTVDLGRLGEESKRLSDIFRLATPYSFLLLNESLATTSVAEGLYIAKDVVKAMRYLGVRCIFNTHMHELANQIDSMNHEEGNSRIESIVTGISNGERSFKVAISPPQGVSYAKDIAKMYGVTYDDIKKEIDEKKQKGNSE